MDELLSLLDDDEFRPSHDELLDLKPLDKPVLKDVDLNLFGNSDSAKYNDDDLKRTIFGDIDSSDDENLRDSTTSKYNEYGKTIKNYLKSQETVSKQHGSSYDKITWKKLPQSSSGSNVKSRETKKTESKSVGKAYHVDVFAGIAIKNPVISSAEMQERLTGRRVIQMHCISLNMRGGDIEGDWVTIGVLVKKCDPKKSSKGSMYSIWNLCNLKHCDDVISMFLFGKTHDQHWKMGVGSVIGILNPSIMPQKDSYKGNNLSITVDNPQKLLYMGVSRDFGICNGRRKDGASCTMFVNKSVCEFCNYHVTKAYYKTASKRMELQSAFSSGEPKGLKQKLLEKQGIFYGGQYFCQPRQVGKSKKTTTTAKGGLVGSMNSHLLTTANAMAENFKKEVALTVTKYTDAKTETPTYANGITTGSRNLLKHLSKESQMPKGVVQPVKSITAKELLKMHANDLAKSTLKNKESLIKSALERCPAPVLGKGFTPGSTISLTNTRPLNNRAKLRAMQKIKSCGPITKVNPNFVPKNRLSTEFQEKIKKRLANESESSESESPASTSKKTKLDNDSLEFQKLLNRKSNHDYLAQEHELDQQNNYFGFMEKKEQLETKLSSIMETSCKVVSCKQCKYTALSALDDCRKDGHNLVVSKAMQRFFLCKKCKKRTTSFSKLPTKPCSGCGEKNYERVSMHQERKGPKIDGEQLLVRGNEINSLNSTLQTHCLNIYL